MPVTRPQYGRKPGPSVTAPDTRSKTAHAKAAADLAQRTTLDTAVAVAVMVATTIVS